MARRVGRLSLLGISYGFLRGNTRYLYRQYCQLWSRLLNMTVNNKYLYYLRYVLKISRKVRTYNIIVVFNYAFRFNILKIHSRFINAKLSIVFAYLCCDTVKLVSGEAEAGGVGVSEAREDNEDRTS